MKAGLIRKGMLALALWTLHLIVYVVLPYIEPAFVNPYGTIETAIVTSFIINEAVSLVENAGLMGVEMPEWLIKRFRQFKYEDDNKKEGEWLRDVDGENGASK